MNIIRRVLGIDTDADRARALAKEANEFVHDWCFRKYHAPHSGERVCSEVDDNHANLAGPCSDCRAQV